MFRHVAAKVTQIHLWVDEALVGKKQHFTVCLTLYNECVIHTVIEKVQNMFWTTTSHNVHKYLLIVRQNIQDAKEIGTEIIS